MSQLVAAKRDLAATKRALDAMRAATTLPEIEVAWRAFLQEANRVWTKLELACRSLPKAQTWFGKHTRTRKKDMLLRYLQHARNADEHTLTEIVSSQPGGFGIGPAPGQKGLYVESLTIRSSPDGSAIDYRGSPASLTLIAPRITLERVLDRGDWYNPPTQHLDSPLPKRDPVTVAELGLSYCERMVGDAEAQFFSPSA